MKKVLSYLLAVMLIISVVPMGAFTFSVGAETDGYYTYTVTDGKATIIDVDDSINGEVIIPNALGGYPVTAIGDEAFSGCLWGFTGITIPNTITSIGDDAFWSCGDLTSVYITDIVAWCNIKFGNIASNPLFYAKNLYLNGKLVTDLSSNGKIKSIGDYAFFGYCNFTSVTIPNNVTSIGVGAFSGCVNLTEIVVDENENYCSVDGVLFNKNKTELINYPVGKSNISYNIPNSVKIIDDTAFYDCDNLTSIIIPNSVTSIGDYVFSMCSGLAKITIPDNVTSMGDYVFSSCSNLIDIHIGSNVASIGDYAFNYCKKLSSITIPNNVKSIGDYAFLSCDSLINANIGSGVVSIGNFAFSHCSKLTGIAIPDSLKSIGDYAFYRCDSLSKIDNPNSIINLGYYAFNDTAYYNDESNFEKEVLYIGRHLIKANHSISGMYIIKDGTLTIADSAFEDCGNLTSITIPKSVTSIASSAFCDCDRLTSITIPAGVTTIQDRTFRGCDNLTSITIPDSVTSIGEEAFIFCDKLVDIWYMGSSDEKANINVNSYNGALYSATWHYNSCIGIDVHTYTDSKDTICNVCGAEKPAYISGDPSGDGAINNKDLALLMQHLNGWSVEITVEAADVNADGNVNNRDYAILMQYINGWDVELQF